MHAAEFGRAVIRVLRWGGKVSFSRAGRAIGPTTDLGGAAVAAWQRISPLAARRPLMVWYAVLGCLGIVVKMAGASADDIVPRFKIQWGMPPANQGTVHLRQHPKSPQSDTPSNHSRLRGPVVKASALQKSQRIAGSSPAAVIRFAGGSRAMLFASSLSLTAPLRWQIQSVDSAGRWISTQGSTTQASTSSKTTTPSRNITNYQYPSSSTYNTLPYPSSTPKQSPQTPIFLALPLHDPSPDTPLTKPHKPSH